MARLNRHPLHRCCARRGKFVAGLRITAASLIAGTLISLPNAASAQQAGLQLQPSAAAQIAVLNQIKASKTATQQKIDSRLFLALKKQRGDVETSALPDFRYVTPEADGRVLVDLIITRPDAVRAVWQQLVELDATILTDKGLVYGSRTVRARVPMKAVEALSAMDEILRVRLAIPARTHAAPQTPGSVASSSSRTPGAFTNALNRSQGLRVHDADSARNSFGTTGAGQTICVLSDGVTSLAASQASGDLPDGDRLFVLPGQTGTGDEGTAMLEIVHDLAPQARLGFATAFTSAPSFAQNILDLATAGCTIIVDDILYLDESPFQDGPIAQSVNTVTGNGVLYFSSAGNEGNLKDGTSGTWEGNFKPSVAAVPPVLASAGVLHDFGDGSNSIRVESGNAGTPAILIWAEHYNATQGLASTDYDLYDLDGALTKVFDASTDTQNGSGGDDFPVEMLDKGAFPGERLVVARVSQGNTSSAPAFNLILFRGRLDRALATSGATRGHSATINAFSTAATPAGEAYSTPPGEGPFPNLFSSGNVSETFSSDGPRRIILSPGGAELTPGNRTITGGRVRQKPDLTAADGVSTAAPGFSTFFGTSAAAPHAAAIAGLLKSALPTLSMAEIRNLMISTAIDIEAPGVDNVTGAGIVMPMPALQAGGAQPRPLLLPGKAVFTQVSGDGDAFIEPNETWSVSLPLTNQGGATASSVRVSLSSSTSGVTIVNADSAYPNIAPGSSAANTSGFTFRVESTFPCGRVINFSAASSYAGSVITPPAFPLSANTGAPGTPVTFRYTGAEVPIPDGGAAGIDIPLAVSGLSGAVNDIDFRIDGSSCTANLGATTVGIAHSFVGDLIVRLVSPAGTVIRLMNSPGGTGNGGNNFCQTTLDDESAGISIQNIVAANAPWRGSFRPASALSGFDGENGNGTWLLRVTDTTTQDSGRVRAFSLLIAGAACDVQAAPGGAFRFVDQRDVARSSRITSAPASITGLKADATISVDGGSYSIGCTATYTTEPGIIGKDQTVCVRHTSSAQFSTDTDTRLTVGGVSDTFTSTTRTPPVGPAIETSVSSYDFGTVKVGNSSGHRNLLITSSGTSALEIQGIVVTGDFSGTHNCPRFLESGKTCTLIGAFKPTVTGNRSGSITITSNAPGSPTVVTLTGKGS